MLSMNAIFKRLRGKRILILGFGREGKSSLAFIQKFLPHAIVGIADRNESAFKDLDLSIKTYSGDNYFDAVKDYDIVIKTPGISLKDKDIDLSKITSQTDLFLEEFHSQIIGITGTKGKSTTSTLIYHLLKESGRDAILAGNIGIPIFDVIEKITNKSIIVFELSAHQLQFIHRSPHIGILLNVFEEHLDHFGTFDAYRNATSLTLPSIGALMLVSIFIASVTMTTSPALTSSPGLATILKILPGIGAPIWCLLNLSALTLSLTTVCAELSRTETVRWSPLSSKYTVLVPSERRLPTEISLMIRVFPSSRHTVISWPGSRPYRNTGVGSRETSKQAFLCLI